MPRWGEEVLVPRAGASMWRCLLALAVGLAVLAPVDGASSGLRLRGKERQTLVRAAEDLVRKRKHTGADVYYIIKMLDRFRKYSVEHQAVADHSHLMEMERLEGAIETSENSHDRALLEAAATRNEESRLETQNAFNEMINFVSTIKQGMGAEGENPTCQDLTCGLHAKCKNTEDFGAKCFCEEGYEGDGMVCKPPIQFTAVRLIAREAPAPQITDMHVTAFFGDRVAVVFRDISQGDRGFFMLGKVGVAEVFWNPVRLFSNQSKAYSPVVAGLPNGRVAVAYRDQNVGGTGILLGAEVKNSVNGSVMFFGKDQAFARHQSHAMSLLTLPNSRVIVLFADRDLGPKGESYGAAMLAQIHEGAIPETMGRYRFVNAPVTRFTATLLTPSTFVVGYREGEGESAGGSVAQRAEASVIWGQMRNDEVIFDPNPVSLEPEQTQIWSRGIALVAKDTFAYAYFSANEGVTKQAIVKVDPGSHRMVILDGPKVVAEGETPFVGTIDTPFAPREPHTFTYFSKKGASYASAEVCSVSPVGQMKHCEERNWAGYAMDSVAGVRLGNGRLLFVFSDTAGAPYYQFVGLFPPKDDAAEEGAVAMLPGA